MRILNEGDRSRAVCLHCKKLREITYRYDKYRDTEIKGRTIENVLQGFCDTCGSLASIPAQSSPKIRPELRRNDTHVEARVTPPLEDILYLVSSRIRLDPQLTLRMLVNFFAQEWMANPRSFKGISDSHNPLMIGKSTCRVSSKMDAGSLSALERIQEKLKITRSELIKAVLLEAGVDLVGHPNSALARKFFKAASLLGTLEANP